MGLASKILHTILRLGELASAAVVLGLINRFFYRLGQADTNIDADARLIYTDVVACLGVGFSLIFLMPFFACFLVFPIDFIMFCLWLVAFCLEMTLTGVDIANDVWYWSYWGYYWGGYWNRTVVVRGPADINWAGLGAWRAVLAFTFIASFTHLCSSFLGCFTVIRHREKKRLEPIRRRNFREKSREAKHQDKGVSEGLSEPTTVAMAHTNIAENSSPPP